MRDGVIILQRRFFTRKLKITRQNDSLMSHSFAAISCTPFPVQSASDVWNRPTELLYSSASARQRPERPRAKETSTWRTIVFDLLVVY